MKSTAGTKVSRKLRTVESAVETDRPMSTATTDELDEVFSSVADYFALLAEPTRLRILHAICDGERSVSSIVVETGATQTNVSRHLALMHQGGVVTRRRSGSSVFYRLDDLEFAAICRMVCVRIAGRIDADQPLKRELLDYAAKR